MKAIFERLSEPTPKFFKKIRNIGLALTGVGAVLLTAPISLPASLVAIGGYLTVAGGIASAISQAAVKKE